MICHLMYAATMSHLLCFLNFDPFELASKAKPTLLGGDAEQFGSLAIGPLIRHRAPRLNSPPLRRRLQHVAASCDWGEDGRDVQREPCREDERRSGVLIDRQWC